ncbi:MAG: Fer [Holophagaceae bacterium]|nr:Fer [Holophagaceae bacterium]
MKIEIKDFCIRCGLCEDLYPELFHFDHPSDSIILKSEEVSGDLIEVAKNAARDCAIAAIHLKN